MSSLTTLPALLVLLENIRIVFSQTPQCASSNAAVTITENSITADAYYQCTTIISLVIASTVTSIGKYIILTIPKF